jgi:hypothetical protein
VVHYVRVKKLADLDDASDETELPRAWYRYLVYATASDLMDCNPAVGPEAKGIVTAKSKQYLDTAKKEDFYKRRSA